jgi:PIN domain nuclease of toxin-antitoxin system
LQKKSKGKIMKLNTSLIGLVVLGASITAPAACAQSVSLQSIISKVLSSALTVTAEELQQQTTLSIVNAADVEVSVNPTASLSSEQPTSAKIQAQQSFKSE